MTWLPPRQPADPFTPATPRGGCPAKLIALLALAALWTAIGLAWTATR